MNAEAWGELRAKLEHERRSYEGRGTNREGRVIAAALAGAYGGVLRMMDNIEARHARDERGAPLARADWREQDWYDDDTV